MSCQYVELEFFLFQAMLWDVGVTVVTQVLFVEGSSSGYKLEREAVTLVDLNPVASGSDFAWKHSSDVTTHD